METATIPIKDAAKNMTLTVNVTGLKVWSWRVRVACWLIWLATKTAGIGFEVER